MQALCVFVYLLGALPIGHLRPLDPWASDTLQIGIERSPTIRALAAELQRSDVIVHIETRTALPSSAVGTTRLAAATASHRYVRVVLYRDALPVNRVAVLAHELQHAVEIARSQVRDADGMRRLFDDIGRPAAGERTAYETDAAIHVSRVVWYEIHGDAKRAARVRAAALPE